MLHLIAGTAGTGKTTRLVGHIRDVVRDGGKAILLVPEQFSFEGEKMLYHALGPRDSIAVEVLSFTRLCNSIFRKYGGLAGVPVTATAKYLLMSISVDELKDTLQVYRKSAGNTAFLDTLLSVCSEFKAAGIPPSELAAFSARCEREELRAKTGELASLYGAYQSLLIRGYTDPDDDLMRACALLEANDFFGGYTVFVDGFTAFMAGEMELLGHIISQSKDIYFAMTADAIGDGQGGMGVFSPVKQAIARLRRMAEKAGAGTAPPEILTEPRRYSDPSLAFLSQSFLQPEAAAFDGVPAAVKVVGAADAYGEVERVAVSIAALVRDKGMRYGDIAVVARDTSPYLRAFELFFGRYGIPYFADAAEDVENKPLVGGVVYALDAVRSNFDAESVLALAKSPIMGLDMGDVAELENYCYIWSVRGAVWQGAFTNNPRGMAENLTEEDTARLDRINSVRAALIDPLLDLQGAVASGNGLRFAKGVFAFMQAVDAAGHISAYAQAMPEGERIAFLDENAQLWDILVEILDIFGTVLGKIRMPRRRLSELFRLAVSAAEVATPPQMLDQVIVGQADRIRPAGVRAVFVLGANEGVFPPAGLQGGVFSDDERQEMIDAGLSVAPPSLQQVILERFYAYFALTLPNELLVVTYRRGDIQGREQMPSIIVSQLHSIFPRLEEEGAPDPLQVVAGENSALALLAATYRQDTPLAATLRAYFAGHSASSRLEIAMQKPPHSLWDREKAKGLFGTRLRLSPSRVERYYRCPFSFFAADGLGLHKRRRVEFSALESGSVIHHVLQVMVQKYNGKGLADCTKEELTEEVRAIIRQYIEERVDNPESLPVRFRHLFGRLCGMLARLLHHLGEEFAQSSFEPVAFELDIRQGEDVEPLRLRTADGIPVLVEGIVDRVDVMTAKNGNKYVRVVDYKSGSKDFKLHDILYGLNLQMLLYLFTIGENGIGALEGAIPAGVLYMPVREQYINAERDGDEEALERQRQKQWCMSGLLLEDEVALRGMEADIGGVFIPAKLKKDGTLDAKSSLAGKAEMGRLSVKVRQLIEQMASSLGSGGIAALPVDGDDYQTCAYCEYRSVCGHEPGDAVRTVSKISKKEFFEILEGEQANG